MATLYTGGSDGFVASTAAPIATGWNEPVPGRDFHPQWTSAFHGARGVEKRRSGSSLPVAYGWAFASPPQSGLA